MRSQRGEIGRRLILEAEIDPARIVGLEQNDVRLRRSNSRCGRFRFDVDRDAGVLLHVAPGHADKEDREHGERTFHTSVISCWGRVNHVETGPGSGSTIGQPEKISHI